jgi:hypothetical protein
MIRRALFPLLRAWKLFVLRAARKSLTRWNPTHPDLPKIVLAIHWWENANA